jgi:hypothetical protein
LKILLLTNYFESVGPPIFDETLPNFIKKKATKKGREKETRGKDQSPGE